MIVPFTARLSVPSDVLIQELMNGESVFLNLSNESYFGLDDTGTRMWKILTASESIQAAYEKLMAEYDVDAELLRHDLGDLVERLIEHRLVEIKDQ